MTVGTLDRDAEARTASDDEVSCKKMAKIFKYRPVKNIKKLKCIKKSMVTFFTRH